MQPYQGKIYDADTHFYEVEDAFSRYLPEKFKKDWSFTSRTTADGNRCMYVGERKVEISEGYTSAEGHVPPPGKLHEWLRAMKDGKDNVDMRVPPTPDMFNRDARLKQQKSTFK